MLTQGSSVGVECSRLFRPRLCPVQGDFGQGMWVLGPLLLFQWIWDSYEKVGIPHSESQG